MRLLETEIPSMAESRSRSQRYRFCYNAIRAQRRVTRSAARDCRAHKGANRLGETKNLFEQETVDDVISRIDKLQPTSQRQWGKMDVAQMMAHCSITMDIASGSLNLPRLFIGRLIGPFARSIYINEKPFSKNGPTGKELVVAAPRDFTREREQLKLKIRQFSEGGEVRCTRHPHPFFGPLTPRAWSRGMYKHLDHHLRQFGV